MGEVCLEEEFFQVVPDFVLVRVAEEDAMRDGPFLAAAAVAPDDALQPVGLGVDAGQQQHGTHRHAFERERLGTGAQLVLVGLLELFGPIFAQGGVPESLQLFLLAFAAFAVGSEEIAHDADPADVRAVGAPYVEGDMRRRADDLAGGVAEDAGIVAGGAILRLVAPAIGDGQVLRLLDQRTAMRAQVPDAVRAVVGPFETVRLVLAAPGDGVILAAFRARHVALQEDVGLALAFFAVAEALELRRRPAH